MKFEGEKLTFYTLKALSASQLTAKYLLIGPERSKFFSSKIVWAIERCFSVWIFFLKYLLDSVEGGRGGEGVILHHKLRLVIATYSIFPYTFLAARNYCMGNRWVGTAKY